MSTAGESAEAVLRLMVDGTEMALRIVGPAAERIVAAILAALQKERETGPTPGKTRVTDLIKGSQGLEIFTIEQKDLKAFVKSAKKYGISYCAVRDKTSKEIGQVDLLVRQEDAVRINRIVEKLGLGAVQTATAERLDDAPAAQVVEDIEVTADQPGVPAPEVPEMERQADEVVERLVGEAKEAPAEREKADPLAEADQVLEELLGKEEAPEAADQTLQAAMAAMAADQLLGVEGTPTSPAEQSPEALSGKPSKASSEEKKQQEAAAQAKGEPEGSRKQGENKRPSVRKQLREIQAAQAAAAASRAAQSQVPLAPVEPAEKGR